MNAQAVRRLDRRLKLVRHHLDAEQLDRPGALLDPRPHLLADRGHAVGAFLDRTPMPGGRTHRFAAGEDPRTKEEAMVERLLPGDVDVVLLTHRAHAGEAVAQPVYRVQPRADDLGWHPFVVQGMVVREHHAQVRVHVPEPGQHPGAVEVMDFGRVVRGADLGLVRALRNRGDPLAVDNDRHPLLDGTARAVDDVGVGEDDRLRPRRQRRERKSRGHRQRQTERACRHRIRLLLIVCRRSLRLCRLADGGWKEENNLLYTAAKASGTRPPLVSR